MDQSVKIPEGFVLDGEPAANTSYGAELPEGFVLVDEPAGNTSYGPELPEGFVLVDEPRSAGGQDINPILAGAGEFAAGTNNAVVELIDFLGPDQVNNILQLAGSKARVPTLGEQDVIKSATSGGFVDEGLGRDVLRTAGSMMAAGGIGGQMLRKGAQQLPTLVSGAESVGAGVLRQMGSSSPKLDLGAGALAGVGSEVGGDAGEYVAGAEGRQVGEMIGSMAAPSAIPQRMGGAGSLGRGAKRIIRPDAKKMGSVIDDFRAVGASPTVGQATGRSSLQSAENLLGQVPGGGPISRAAQSVKRNMQKRLIALAESASPKAGLDFSGVALKSGITGQGGFIDRFNAKSSILWGKVDDFLPAGSSVSMSNTARAIDDVTLSGKFGPALNNSKIMQMKAVLDQGESVSFEELKALRSFIGRELSGTDLSPNIPRAQLKRMYSALSEDTRAAVGSAGPEALNTWTRANNYSRGGHKRLDNYVKRIAEKGDLQKVYEAVIRGTEDVATINAFKRSLKPEEWNVVASNALRQMGKATPGQQNTQGNEFSINKFLTDWSKLGSKARNAIFSGTPQLNQFSRDLDKIARVAQVVKEASRQGANPSGSAQAAANYATAGAATGAFFSGNMPILSGILATVAANRAATSLMTYPKFVNWLARTPSEPAKLQAHIAGLAAIANKSSLEESMAIYDLMNDLEQKGGGSR